jgi:DNA-binding beta-propeller fold protein YncE
MSRPFPVRARAFLQTVRLALVVLATTGASGWAETTPPVGRVIHEGVAVDYAFLPVGSSTATPRAGEPARVRFTITDTTTGKPLARLNPAAWLSRRGAGGATPQTCDEKIREFLGGSIFAKADVDMNTFRVLALNDDATITVVDPLFGFGGTKLLALVPLASPGEDWTLGADGARLFVTQPAAGRVAVVDTASWRVAANLAVEGSPGRVALQPDGHYLWVAREGGVTVITAGDAEPVVAAKIETGPGRHEIVFSADNRWAFVTNTAGKTLSVIDVRLLKKERDLPLAEEPAALAYSSLSDAVYLVDSVKGEIVVVDAAKHTLVARIPALPGVAGLRFAPGERFGVALNPTGDRVQILDAATNRIVQTAAVDGAPEQVAFSGDMAFIRRRGTPIVAMLPLKEIGREGKPVAVAEFTGGEAAFGERTALADGLMAAPGESAVVVANPKDKAIYYYMTGMAAPMGNFGNYDRVPRAVLVVDRSLREVSPGVYETSVTLPAAGAYDTVFFLGSPRIAHCFETEIPANPDLASVRAGAGLRLEPVSTGKLVAGTKARVAFRLRLAPGSPQLAPADLAFRILLAPGVWNRRKSAEYAADGTAGFEFTPPEAGMYYIYAEAPSLGLALNHAPVLILEAVATTAAPTP